MTPRAPARFWLALVALYAAQGLPFGFFTQALPVLMRQQGVGLVKISLAGLLMLPWSFKFLWAPLVDRWHFPGQTVERSWILPCLGLSAAALVALAWFPPSHGFAPMMVAFFAVTVCAATQDIATDRLAVRGLAGDDRGHGNGVQVGAYRLGMVLGGGVLLGVFTAIGWHWSMLAMAALLLACGLPVVLGYERAGQPASGASPASAPVPATTPAAPSLDVPAPPEPTAPHPLAALWARARQPGLLPFCAILILFRFGHSASSGLAKPLLVDHGFTTADIARVLGVYAFLAATVGAFSGGWVIKALGRLPTLCAAGVAQSLSVCLYVLALWAGGSHPLLGVAAVAEHFLDSFATVAAFTLMMDASDPEHAGTDYTLFSCVILTVTGGASIVGAWVAEWLGYEHALLGMAGLSMVGAVVAPWLLARGFGPARLRGVTAGRLSVRPA